MLGLKLNHVSKRAPWRPRLTRKKIYLGIITFAIQTETWYQCVLCPTVICIVHSMKYIYSFAVLFFCWDHAEQMFHCRIKLCMDMMERLSKKTWFYGCLQNIFLSGDNWNLTELEHIWWTKICVYTLCSIKLSKIMMCICVIIILYIKWFIMNEGSNWGLTHMFSRIHFLSWMKAWGLTHMFSIIHFLSWMKAWGLTHMFSIIHFSITLPMPYAYYWSNTVSPDITAYIQGIIHVNLFL